MKRSIAAALALVSVAAAPVQAQEGEPNRGRAAINANPSALIAAEFAIFRLAQDKGLWKALRETAAPEAVLFEPGRVDADDWLKGRKQSAAPIRYSPLQVWTSCDGGHGVVQGYWRQEEAAGRFVTVWQRQEKGDFKWLLRRRDSAPVESDGLDLIDATVADCARKDSAALQPLIPEGVDGRKGASKDNSLHWREFFEADGSWNFVVQAWDGIAFPVMFTYEAPPTTLSQ